MDTIFMISKSSKTSDSHRLLLNLTDQIDLERSDVEVVMREDMSLYQIFQHLLYMEKRSKSYKIKKFKISTPTGNEEFELSD